MTTPDTEQHSPDTEQHSPEPQKITMFGADWCRDCRRAKLVFEHAGVPFTYVDLVADPAAAQVAIDISGRRNIPVVVFPDGTYQVEPSNADLHSKFAELGLS